MNDMRDVIIPKSDQLNSDSLLAGPITITVTAVSIKPGTEQPVAISYTGDEGRPYKPCKSMARVLVHCWGADANQYVGRSMTLYCDPKVTWGGMAVGGIRISHMTDIKAEQVMALTATRGNKKPFTVRPLTTTEKKGAAVKASATQTIPPEEQAWLAQKAADLEAAVTGEEYDVITESIQKEGRYMSPDGQGRLNALCAAAIARIEPASETEDDGEEA